MPSATKNVTGRFLRLGEANRRRVPIKVDDVAITALEGDTVMVAVLSSGRTLRQSEFEDSDRAGFCLMGACQDCWMWTTDGARMRACTTTVSAGMELKTEPASEQLWPIPG